MPHTARRTHHTPHSNNPNGRHPLPHQIDTLAPAPAATTLPETSSETPAQRRATVRAHIIFALAAIVLLLLAWMLNKELRILYVSALFAVVLTPVTDFISKLKIKGWQPSRAVSIVLLIVGIVAALTLFLIIGLPPVLSDLRNFLTDLPTHIPNIVAKLKRLPFADKLGVDSLAERAESAATATGGYLLTSLPKWLSHIFDILTAAFLCIYFMLEGDEAYKFFLSLFKPASRLRLDITLRKAEVKMSKWLLGQGLLMAILGGCSLIVFGVLHVRYFILLGVLMGLFNIIPIAGGVITIVVAAGVAAIDSWAKMAGVLIFYVIYVNLENAVLTPRIMKSSVDLMGLTVLVALLIGTALAGIVGALVAVPTAALIAVLLEEYAVQRDTDTALSPAVENVE